MRFLYVLALFPMFSQASSLICSGSDIIDVGPVASVNYHDDENGRTYRFHFPEVMDGKRYESATVYFGERESPHISFFVMTETSNGIAHGSFRTKILKYPISLDIMYDYRCDITYSHNVFEVQQD